MAAGPLTRVPPIVRYRGGGGWAFVLAQVRTPQGWKLRLTWAEIYVGETQWRWEVAEVDPSAIERVDGELYSNVPIDDRTGQPPSRTAS